MLQRIIAARKRRRCLPWEMMRVKRSVRIRGIECWQWLHEHGWSRRLAARRIGMSVDTLYGWRSRWRKNKMKPEQPGPVKERLTRYAKRILVTLLAAVGPNIGLPRLRKILPEFAKTRLTETLALFKRWSRKNPSQTYRLSWKRSGAVWAMDFMKPPAPVDGEYRQVLSVRDLGSSFQLDALACESENAESAVGALESLFVEWGAPLVIKSDNGSAFISWQMRALLGRYGVLLLLSPPRTPSYNGGCEAGNGAVKMRTVHEARRRGRPGHWTCDDLEFARCQSNDAGQPRGPYAPSPAETWQGRTQITTAERFAFGRRYENAERRERQLNEINGDVLGRQQQAWIDRLAIADTLQDFGLLELQRR
ncbi:transposase family protein [bacterium AH-315-M10]|nr:transposase family protein [bacterium AH-315-M10]